jgi:hypothetical protein
MKIFFILLTCFWAWGTSFAQKPVNVSGAIADERNEFIAFAVVKLVRNADTSVIKQVQTNLQGNFVFDQVSPGSYHFEVSKIGFQNAKTAVFVVESLALKWPTIKLEGATKQLKEVTVQAKKQLVEFKADKTVINVEGSIVSAGNSVLEVLEKAPGVTVDRRSEQIKLNNKSGITIMIDGKTNFLSGTDITTLLSNMGSDQVATIELITNPSAKYDAAGNAGIINIKLKRNKAFGTNGNLSLNTWKGLMPNAPSDLYRAGLQLSLNHRVNKINVYTVAAFNRKANYNTTSVDRTTATSNLASKFNQGFARNSSGVAYMGKVGLDYYATERTVFGVMVDANSIVSNLDNLSTTQITETQPNLVTNNSVLQQADAKSPVSNLTANFNIRHEFDKNGKSLTFDADYSGFSNEKNENFNAQYYDQDKVLNNTTALRNLTDAKIDIYAAKTDFTLPIGKTLKFETGLKSSYVVTNNDFRSEQLIGGAWQNDLGKSNYFIYKENINAAYANVAQSWDKWQVQLGLRAEHTHSNGNSVTDQNEVDRNYLSLFPSIFVSQTLNKDNNIRYSYSRRVDRPNYQQLNPFVFYMDPFALDEGNPYLKPQFTDNFELGYSYKTFSLSLNYSDTRDMITQISQQNETIRIVNVIRKNLGRAQNYAANLYVPIEVNKFWKMQQSLSVFYAKFNDDNLEGASYSAGKVAYNFNTSQSFSLPKDFTVEINFWLNSPRINGVEETTIYQYALNAGIQKSIMNKKLKFSLNIDDIFLTNRWEGKLKYQNVNLQVANRYLSRRVGFSVNYNFGNQQVKAARNRNTATDDIKNRAN